MIILTCTSAGHRVQARPSLRRLCASISNCRSTQYVSLHQQPCLLLTLRVSAGELGTKAEELEERPSLIFERASKWKELLLLDEADVFLEQRADRDIYRNALVCVFLRTLEYYQGILFLTTNRVGQIDDAIASRIHFKIKYTVLSLEQRRQIWKDFLSEATTAQGEPVYSRAGLESLAQKKLNGREVTSSHTHSKVY